MKKRLILALIPLINYSQNVKIEVDYGRKASFGIDQADKLYNLLYPVLKLSLPLEYEEYMPVYKEEEKVISNTLDEKKDVYIPVVGADVIDPTLAIRYLYQAIKYKNNLNVKIDFEKVGLAIKMENELDDFTNNYKIKKSKLSFLVNNKFLKGKIAYNVIGENEKASLTNIDGYNLKDHKKLEYNFDLDLLTKYKYRPSLTVKGLDKKATVIPSFKYIDDKGYITSGIAFDIGNDNKSIKNEINKVKYSAPGYEKIEYFKKWTLKDEKVNLEKKEDYLNEAPDYINAKVSGYKGTYRILDLPSGSLYGDNPITFITNSFREKIEENDKLKVVNDVIRKLEDKQQGNIDFAKIGLQMYLDSLKTNYVDEFNKVVNDVSKDVYKKIGIDLNKEYSNYHIINQVPEIFRDILPGVNPDFYLLGINSNIFDPRWLYFNGLIPENVSLGKKVEVENNSVEVNGQNDKKNQKILDKLPKEPISYEKRKEYHYVGPDFNRYIYEDNIEKYKIRESLAVVDNLLHGSTWGKVKAFFNLFTLKNSELNKNLSPFLQDPARNIHGLDMARGIYFHNSEKNKNILELEEELAKISFDEKNIKVLNYPYFNLKGGYHDKYVNFNVETNLGKFSRKYNDEIKFEKLENDINLNTILKYKRLVFSNNLNLNFSKNDFNTKKDTLSYYDLNFLSNTLLGVNFDITKKWNMQLALSHIGQIGYIKPLEIKINEKEYEKEIAKRDKDNNPIGLDGKSIKVNETTEFALIDKYANEIDKEKNTYKRKIHPTMYLEKEKSKAKDYVYSVYNILNPKVTLKYMPSDNVEFTNEVMLPFAINRSNPSGVNLVLSSNIKYILGDKDFNIFTDFNPIELKTKGDISLGYSIKDNAHVKYNSYLDLSFLRFNIEGMNKKYSLDTEINPLVLNFNIRPKIILSLNDRANKLNFTLEAIDKDKYIAQVGLSKVLNNKVDIKQDLMSNLKEIMSTDIRTDKEREAIDKFTKENKIDDKFIKAIQYKLTPYISLNKNGENIKYKVKFDYIYGTNEKKDSKLEKGEFRVKEEDIKALDNIIDKFVNGEEYITKTYHGKVKHELYFLEFPRYAEDNLKESTIDLKYQDYLLNTSLNMNKKGFFFDSDIDLRYNKTSYKETFKEVETTHVNREIYVIESSSLRARYAPNSYQFREKIKVEAVDPKTGKVFKDENGKDLYIDAFLKISDTREENEQNIKDHIKLRGKKGYGYEKIEKKEELLNKMVKNNHKYIITKENFNNLVTKKINLSTNSSFGYKYDINDKFSTSFLLNHKFDLNYLNSESIIYNDLKLFGSKVLSYKNTITPKIDANYKIFKHLNVNIDTGIPITINDKKEKKVGFDLGLDLNINW